MHNLLCWLLLPLLAALVGCSRPNKIALDTDNAGEAELDKPAPPMPPTPPGAQGEKIESPIYKMWAKFPVGSQVTHKTTTENEDSPQKTVTTITYLLKEKTEQYILVESQATTVHFTGRVETNPPSPNRTERFFTLPPGVKKPEPAKKKADEMGEETLTLAGKKFKTNWYTSRDSTEAGPLSAKTWTSDDMPGGLVKSISKVPAKKATITVEVTEVKIP